MTNLQQQEFFQYVLKNQEIKDLEGLTDSDEILKKKFQFWNEVASMLISIEHLVPKSKFDENLYNSMKEIIGLRNIELVKIIKSKM